MNIRSITKQDNEALAKVIRLSLELLDFALPGTVYTDSTTDIMSEQYLEPRSAYWVVEIDGKIMGGCGIKTLPGNDGDIAELQRMFLHPDARGKGISRLLMNKCVEYATQEGFKKIYLETSGIMKDAIRLYENSGFKKIEQSLGLTGHFSCEYYMLKDL